jgi:uncharacterized NAD-dependent epimerase/dehydratase family protein
MTETQQPGFPEGNAVVYCQGAFGTTNGKTAHGLIRRSERYRVLSLVDSKHAGKDAGSVLDRRPAGIPVVASLAEALTQADEAGTPLTHFVVGLAPDGGRLGSEHRSTIHEAIHAGLNVDCGLHDFLSEDAELAAHAEEHGVTLRDVRKPPARQDLHFFTGKIEQVDCLKIALLGTDSAVGKRTTAWLLVDALRAAGHRAELVGTGQTAWMQGSRYGIITDSIVSDFVSGELEHATWSAWRGDGRQPPPAAIVLEGQGSLMNPAYPGGFELLAATRPDVIVLQHAPARKEYDGFPGYPIQPLPHQIQALELISAKPVVAITVNHEDLEGDEIDAACAEITRETGLPAFDALRDGAAGLVEILAPHLRHRGVDVGE